MFDAKTVDFMAYMSDHTHEQVVMKYDDATGLRAIIAVHSTALGPSLGGTRLWRYEHSSDALLDVLRLSEGMTYKNAIAGLKLGGGKAVIMADGRESNPAVRRARFEAFGKLVNSMNGIYVTAEDVGTLVEDMIVVKQQTNYVGGLPLENGGSGDPSPMTAYGVMVGMEAAAQYKLGTHDLKGVRVAVQGLGKVGYPLVEMLLKAGAIVTATDISKQMMHRAATELNIAIVGADDIYDVECEIFAPCALGAVINDETLDRLNCQIIAGAANNQLEDVEKHSRACDELGIVYAVDYVVNAGGVINVAEGIGTYDYNRARAKTAKIFDTVQEMLHIADAQNITTQAASQILAHRRLGQVKAPQPVPAMGD